MKKIFAALLAVLIIAPVAAAAEIPGIAEYEELYSADFTAAASLDAAGITATIKAGDPVQCAKLTPDGLLFKGGETESFLVQNSCALNAFDSYIVDFTFGFADSAWIFFASFGYASPLAPAFSKNIDDNGSFKMRADEGDNKYVCDSYSIFADEEYTELIPCFGESDRAALGGGADMRVRLVVTAGTSRFAFVTIGKNEYYLVRNSPLTSIEGYFGFTFVGSAKESRGVVIKKLSVSKINYSDPAGGVFAPDGEVPFTDTADTLYRRGYILHYIDFSKIDSFEDTKYGFTSDSSPVRNVRVKDGCLRLQTLSTGTALLLFSGNGIPKAVSDFTAEYKFRFVNKDAAGLGFIQGMEVTEEGGKKNYKTVNMRMTKKIDGATPADAGEWSKICDLYTKGEWVTFIYSSAGRAADLIRVKCGGYSCDFSKNGNAEAPAGYLGLIIGAHTTVDLAYIKISAGKYAEGGEIWPFGENKAVQTVSADAVLPAEGTVSDTTFPSDTTFASDTTFTSDTTSASDAGGAPDGATDYSREKPKKNGCGSLLSPLALLALIPAAFAEKKKKR